MKLISVCKCGAVLDEPTIAANHVCSPAASITPPQTADEDDLEDEGTEDQPDAPFTQPGATEKPDPIAEWDSALAEKIAGGTSRHTAMRQLVHGQPQLHRDYLEAYNEKRRVRR